MSVPCFLVAPSGLAFLDSMTSISASVCTSTSSLCLPLSVVRALVIGFMVQPRPGQCLFGILTLTTPAKTLVPHPEGSLVHILNNSEGPGEHIFRGTPFNLLHSLSVKSVLLPVDMS